MGTRQQRLDDVNTIKASIQNISGEKVNIVLKDRTVIFGTILGLENDALLIKNMRLKKQKVALDALAELILDKKQD